MNFEKCNIPAGKREEVILACLKHVTPISVVRMTGVAFLTVNRVIRQHNISTPTKRELYDESKKA